jgi:hypothetical protein
VLLTRATNDGRVGDSVDAKKTWEAAKITIAPNATNEVGQAHTFVVTLQKDTGNGAGFVAAAGETVTVTLTNSSGAVASPAGPFTGTTNASGQFQVTFNSQTTGKVTGHASSTLSIGSPAATFTVQTDGTGLNSGDAVKTFVDANIQITPANATNRVNAPHTFTAHVNVNGGGGSFANAPLLESGRYRDTILPGERLFYGVRLEPGQRLRVRAKLDVDPGEVDTDTAAGFSIGLQTPLREVITDTDEDISGNSTVGSVEDEYNVIFPAAVAPSAAVGGSGGYRGPGIWYPSLYLSSVQRKPAKAEFPVEFEFEVIGEPQKDASPEPTPGKEATPAPEKTADEGDGTSAAAVAGIGVFGLLVGLVGGGFAARRRG